MMKRSLLVLAAVAIAACAQGSGKTTYDQQQTEVPITPKGTITGRVLELGTATPLAGVTVTLNTPTVATATTSSTGLFTFADVVVNSEFQLVFEKDGYVRNTSSAVVPGSVNYAGSTPLAGGNANVEMSLGKAEGAIKGIVFLPNQRPAVNATVVVDQRRSYLSNVGGSIGESVVTVKTGMDGSFTLTGLASAPAGVTHRVVAQWFDENGDMQADYGSTTSNVEVLGADPSRVFLHYSNIGQTVIDSNLFDGEIAATDSLDFTFALPVLTSGQNQAVVDQFSLYDLTTNTQIAVEQTWASPVKVSVKPVGGPLKESDQYQVNINLKLLNASTYGASYVFQVRAGTVTGPTTQVTNFTVTNPARTPNTTFDYADTQFTLAWNSVPGVSSYNVYAKDTTSNQTYVYLTRFTPNIGTGRLTLPLTINSQAFNRGRPLSEGNKMTFAVVAVDGYGNTAPLGAAPTAVVGDNVQPTTNGGTPARYPVGSPAPDGINDTAAAQTVQLRLTYSEPMDATTAPVFTNGGGAVTQSFVWEAGFNSGIMTLTVPAGGDITGPFTIRGGKDSAGNVLANVDFTGRLGGRKELLVNGNFEDAAGACNVTGWTATGTPAPVGVLNNNSTGTGKCAAVLGSPFGTTPTTGLTKISQDVVLAAIPTASADLGWFYQYSVDVRPEYITTGVGAAVTQRCRITDPADVQIVGALNLAYASANNAFFTSASGSLAPMQTVRLQCEVNNTTTDSANAALFIDSASIALVKPGTL